MFGVYAVSKQCVIGTHAKVKATYEGGRDPRLKLSELFYPATLVGQP